MEAPDSNRFHLQGHTSSRKTQDMKRKLDETQTLTDCNNSGGSKLVSDANIIAPTTTPAHMYPFGLDLDVNSTFSRQIFLWKDYGCIAFNFTEKDKFEIPPYKDVVSAFPRHLRQMQMYSNEHPFAAYVMSKPNYDDKQGFLRRLNYTYSTLPVIITGDGPSAEYQMEHSLRTSWLRLENALIVTVSCFRKFFDCLYNLDFKRPRFPSERGFLGSYKTEAELRQRCMDSKEAFGLLLAFVTFYLTGSPLATTSFEVKTDRYIHSKGATEIELPSEDSPMDSWPLWAREIAAQKMCHPEWLQMLLFSELSDFTKPRAGCVIETDLCEFLHNVPRMLRRRIPLVFKWPIDDPSFGLERLGDLHNRYRTLVQLTHTERQILRTERAHRKQNKSSPEPKRLPTPSTLVEARRKMALYHSHGKLEEYQEKVSTRAKGKEITYQQRGSPGQGKDVTNQFEGSSNPQWSSFAGKTYVHEIAAQDFDIPKPDENFSESNNTNDEGPLPSTNLTAPLLETMKALPKENDLVFKDWDNFIISTVSQPAIHSISDRVKATALEPPFFSVTLKDRFGWHPPITPYTFHPSLSFGTVTEKDLKDARRTLSACAEYDDLSCLGTMVTLHFCNFAAFVGDLMEEECDPPSSMWDLSTSGPFYLGNKQTNVQIEHVEGLLGIKTLVLFKLQVARVSQEDVEAGEVEDDEDWDLFVRDPSTAVECLRRQFVSTKDIARTLATQGSEFFTGAVVERRNVNLEDSTANSRKVLSLGWREVNYKPDLGDFAVYKAKVCLFLRQPRSRAAWKFGGLVWRIAQYFSESGMKNDGIYLDGPTVDSASFQIVSPKGQCWRADILSEDEVDLLIGKYRVYTGEYISCPVLASFHYLFLHEYRAWRTVLRNVMVAAPKHNPKDISRRWVLEFCV